MPEIFIYFLKQSYGFNYQTIIICKQLLLVVTILKTHNIHSYIV